MNTIKNLIHKKIGVGVEILTEGYDKERNVYYSCCLFGSSLCYFEIAEDDTEIIICTDDETTLNNISKILKNKKNNNVSTYNNVLYNSTNNTQYYMYRHMLKCDTQVKIERGRSHMNKNEIEKGII